MTYNLFKHQWHQHFSWSRILVYWDRHLVNHVHASNLAVPSGYPCRRRRLFSAWHSISLAILLAWSTPSNGLFAACQVEKGLPRVQILFTAFRQDGVSSVQKRWSLSCLPFKDSKPSNQRVQEAGSYTTFKFQDPSTVSKRFSDLEEDIVYMTQEWVLKNNKNQNSINHSTRFWLSLIACSALDHNALLIRHEIFVSET